MKYLLLLLIVTGSISTRAQNIAVGKVKGQLVNEDDGQPLAGATVALLYVGDSSMVISVITDKKGAFVLDRLRVADYELYITYLGYRAIRRRVVIGVRDILIDLGVIQMQRAGITLELVEIVGTIPPMVVKKDTLEFNAGAFNVGENAVLGELLKKLPGIQVEKDGTIKVNGEPVKKLLIDGKPFFGDDLKISAGNLMADIIDKVQFIDKQSDWVAFTGIRRGQTEKTINITIKKDRKGKYLGQVRTAAGTHERFSVKGHVNRFSEEQQMFSFGRGTNINGYEDTEEQGRMAIGGNSNVRNWAGGGNYNRDFGKKLKLGAGYAIEDRYIADQRNSERQNLLPDTAWYYNQNTHIQSTNTGHTLNTWFEYKPDTMHVLLITTSTVYATRNDVQENGYTSLGGRKQLVNSGAMRMANATNAPGFSATVLLGKKFSKAGRSFSFKLDARYNASDQQGFNKSDNSFVEPGGDTFTDTINQRIGINSRNRLLALSLTYTEPLSKDRYLELTYAYTPSRATSDRFTYDYNTSKNQYDLKNDSLSNAFINKTSSKQAGIRILTQKSRYDYNIGVNILFCTLNNHNITENSKLQHHFVNVFPSADFSYSITPKKRLQASYTGNSELPSTVQLQPVPDNSNPLYMQLGNPGLKPAFSHLFSGSYNASDPATMRNFLVSTNLEFIRNKIVNTIWFDSLGRQRSQPQNVNGAFNMRALIYNNFPLRKLQTLINTITVLNFNRDVSSINGVKGDVKKMSATQSLVFNYRYKEVFDFATNASANYNSVRYSVQKDNNTHYFSYTFAFDCNIYLPLGFRMGGNLDYMLSTGRTAGYNQDVVMLNAFISKGLFKRRQALLRLEGFDLLNRNVGISRIVGQYYIEDVQTTVSRRLLLISFSYFLKK